MATEDALAGPVQLTLALIKPDAAGTPWVEQFVTKVPPADDGSEDGAAAVEKWDAAPEIRAADKSVEILKRVRGAGFKVVRTRLLHMSKAQAEAFYAEHAGKPFFETLTSFMSSGPTLALVLERENAIKEWRALMGPTNAIKAREQAEAEHPLNEDLWSLRALYGTDGTRNATHGSDSEHSAAREIAFFFPDPEVFERSAVIVLPHAVATGAADGVAAALEAQDFLILARRAVMVSPDTAALLTHDAAAAAALCDGAAEAIIVERVGAVPRLVALTGPPPSVAKASAPATLHAKLGQDDAHVGVVTPTVAHRDAVLAALIPEPLPLEHTLCVIKPGTADKFYREVIAEVTASGFSIVAEVRRTLAREEVEAFYAEHVGKPFFDRLCTYMCSAPVIALALAKPNAIRNWRQLMGPTEYAYARRERPTCLRARFAEDSTRNALHGSDSPASAARELRFYFPHLSTQPSVGPAALSYIKQTQVTTVYDPTRKALVPKTLEGVIVDALAELARKKPSSDPAAAIRWLGEWLVDHNPAHGVVAHPEATRVRVHDPETESSPSSASAAAVPAAATVTASAPAPTIIFVLGGPGSGKGTQCDRIVKEFGFTHLSTGDLLREEVASGSARGAELSAVMKSGGLVSDAVVLTLLSDAMKRSGGTRFLVDGYPRTLAQATAFERAVGAPQVVIAYEASDAVLEARLLDRGRTSGRADDNLEAIRSRLATFKAQSEPVIDFYSKLGLVRRINSERSKEAVFAATFPHLQPEFTWIVGPPGSGRSELARALATTEVGMGYHYIDMALAAAAEVASGSEEGHVLEPLLARGDPLPEHCVIAALQRAIAAAPLGRYVLDGAPRDGSTAAALEHAFGAPRAVLVLDIDDAAALERAVAAEPRATSERRAALKKSLALYRRVTAPFLSRYDARALATHLDASCSPAALLAAARRALVPEMVFVLGGPGSGKGTQCTRISSTFGYLHLSAGDLLRAEVERGSAHGDMIQSYMRDGKIVPMEVTLNLLRTALTASRASRVLIDGFPRDVGQAIAFEAAVGQAAFVLFFDVPEAVMRSRLLERAKTSGRVDDNEASIAKRFKSFVDISMPVIEHYAASGKVQTIDATPSPEEVFDAIRPLFSARVIVTLGAPGVGKTTQAERVSSEFGFTRVSVLEVLGAEAAAGTERGHTIAAALADGDPVADATVLEVLAPVVAAVKSRRIILDDVPPRVSFADALDAALGVPRLVLHYTCTKDAAKARVLKRGKAGGRKEDTEAGYTKRSAAYDSEGAAVVARYRTVGCLMRDVSSLQSSDAAMAEIRPLLQPTLALLVGTLGSGRRVLARRAGRELGYHTLHVSDLLRAEVDSRSSAGKAIAAAMASKRTAPVDAVLHVIRQAMLSSPARRFLLDGFPRVVSAGFPSVHDQVFELEAQLGVVRGCINLEASVDVRAARTHASTPGQLTALRASVETYRREKLPVVAFFQKLGKAAVIDTTAMTPQEVYDAALPLLQ